jgi:hypothetical protein
MMLIAALLLSATQEIDNPEYTRWASCKIGSWVKMRSEIEAGGNKIAVPTTMTTTLIELDEKQVVVEQVMATEIEGAAPEKAKKKTYRAKIKRKEAAEKEGDEEIEVGGKKLTCHWVEAATAAASSKTWTHPDVPGGTVRLEIVVGADKSRITRLYATTWEKK